MDKKLEKKYVPLAHFFQNASQVEITLTFEALENIMGQGLPNAAYLNASWWKKTKPPLTHYFAWVDSEYYVIDVRLGHSITFSKLKNSLSTSQDENKNTMVIRNIESDDARNYINLLSAIYAESTYEYYNNGKFSLTVQQLRKTLTEWKKQRNCNVLLCIVDGQIAGYVEILGYEQPHKKHIATIRVGVIKKYQKIGVATELIKRAEQWAKNHDISRLQCFIHEQNQLAIECFQKAGFIQEGILKQGFKTTEQSYDEFMFAKVL